MSNSSLINRMQHILDEYEAGRLSSEQGVRALRFHMDGIEGVGLSTIHRLSSLAHDFERAHTFCGDDEFIDPSAVAEVLSELRYFLRSLPGGDDP